MWWQSLEAALVLDQPGLVGWMMTGTATTDESANSLKNPTWLQNWTWSKPAKPGPAEKSFWASFSAPDLPGQEGGSSKNWF